MGLFELVFIGLNLVKTYVIYKFMHIFFKEVYHKKLEKIAYLCFYIFVTLFYIMFKDTRVHLASNMVWLTFIAYNYKSTFKKKILVVLFTLLMFVCTESIVIVITGFWGVFMSTEGYYASIFGNVLIHFFYYIGICILGKFVNIREGEIVSTKYWISILVSFFGTVGCIIILFDTDDLVIPRLLFCLVSLFSLNILYFSLYDSMIASIGEELERQSLVQQNYYYEKEYDQIQKTLKSAQVVRHDLLNHLTSLQSLIEESENQSVKEYLQSWLAACNQSNFMYVEHIIIDSILKSKAELAHQQQIQFQVDATLPSALDIDAFDLTIILGNLLDNAILATVRLQEEKRFIHIKIKYDRGSLGIIVENSYDGNVHYQKGKIQTINKNYLAHGIGLMNVKNAVKKYEGSFHIEHTEEQFATHIILFTIPTNENKSSMNKRVK